MTLSRYLETKNLTATAFAAEIGVEVSTVSRIVNGARRPEWATMEKIMAATGGLVTPNDFLSEARLSETVSA